MSTTARFAKNRCLFERGGTLDVVFIITDGLIKFYQPLADGQRQIMGFLGPGDIVGGMQKDAGAHCTAEAITEVGACVLTRASFLRLLRDYPDLCFKLLSTATDVIKTQHDQMTLLGCKQGPERLAAFLLMINRRWTFDGTTGDVVLLPMSRTDIADHLGQTIESVSRAFRRLRTLGYIELSKPNRVTLKNIPALQDLAGLEELPAHGVWLSL